ncbi:deubiquitinase OTUD6B [Aricia agestis]|uniref:deubiquitinase OTUD6B n=1 Tax=Aricia agestis TaxID=91739 RepID=UPI001C207764|nr:deubiquitinase OTUD6B [Aricia agestis]XP_041969485.1 deubiquitinase OTUD6B [Aricia agestis]
MDDNSDENEVKILEQKHKKEKKELQAQIQAIKKAAKNDKTKKKELTLEITRLETELDEKHKKELESVQNANQNIELQLEPEELEVKETSKTKISKAQKRRDKKKLLERERNEQIELQEQENKNGPRNLEMQAIHTRLKTRNLSIFLIPSDGDCLYKAIAHQLEVQHNKKLNVQDLRNNAASYIMENKDDFLPFLSNPETFEMLTDAEFEEYCEKIRNTNVWGGQVEIRALSNYLKCPISIIQATGPETIEQGTEFTGPPLFITYHRHMYSLGEHYNSTQTLTTTEEV